AVAARARALARRARSLARRVERPRDLRDLALLRVGEEQRVHVLASVEQLLKFLGDDLDDRQVLGRDDAQQHLDRRARAVRSAVLTFRALRSALRIRHADEVRTTDARVGGEPSAERALELIFGGPDLLREEADSAGPPLLRLRLAAAPQEIEHLAILPCRDTSRHAIGYRRRRPGQRLPTQRAGRRAADDASRAQNDHVGRAEW